MLANNGKSGLGDFFRERSVRPSQIRFFFHNRATNCVASSFFFKSPPFSFLLLRGRSVFFQGGSASFGDTKESVKFTKLYFSSHLVNLQSQNIWANLFPSYRWLRNYGGEATHSHMGIQKKEEEEEAQFRFGVWVDTEATVKVSPVTRSVSPRRKRRKSQNIPGKNLSFPRKSFSVKRRRERGASALKSPHF